MAASFMKKTMAYLGLVDDDYDDYDDYDARSPSPVGRATPTRQRRRSTRSTSLRSHPSRGSEPSPGTRPRARQWPHRPRPSQFPAAVGSSSVRPISPESAGARVHIVAPGRFADAQEIANRLMNNQPVIVNMQSADRDLQRRMIDFCSGVTYALSGGMERVADEVFLLTPSNVKVSDEERQRLADRGSGQSLSQIGARTDGRSGTGRGVSRHDRTSIVRPPRAVHPGPDRLLRAELVSGLCPGLLRLAGVQAPTGCCRPSAIRCSTRSAGSSRRSGSVGSASTCRS